VFWLQGPTCFDGEAQAFAIRRHQVTYHLPHIFRFFSATRISRRAFRVVDVTATG
jgi:hypothetical protein